MSEWIEIIKDHPETYPEKDIMLLLSVKDVSWLSVINASLDSKYIQPEVCMGYYSGYGDVWYFSGAYGDTESAYSCVTDDMLQDNVYDIYTNVTHWMPLPKPPVC